MNAPKTVTLTGHIYCRQDYGTDQPRFSVLSFKSDDAKYVGVWVGETQFDFTLPEGWNLTAAEIATLEAEKRAALDDYNATVQRINIRLSKLQAIANDVPA